jgi:hypothetical protein
MNYLINRLHTYPLSKHAKESESDIKRTILQNNKHTFAQNPQKTSKPRTYKKNTTTKKWAIFTYVGREIRTITKLFKDANINTAYKTHNTIEHILWSKL